MFAALVATAILSIATLLPGGPLIQGRNSIEGRVTTPENKTLDNVRVFLMNDSYGQRGQTYTDGSGRYQFRNLGSGNYYVEVEAPGTGYERQSQRIEVNPYDPSGRGGAEIFRLDFVLKPEKFGKPEGSDARVTPGADRVIFVQEIPPAAREAYEQGAQSLKKADLKLAEVGLTHAIELFPDYYDALELLGTEYVKHAYYDSALPLLTHAVEINKNAWHSYYGLGVSLLELGRRQEGIEALRYSVRLNTKSVNAAMRLGLELGKEEQYSDEAIKLLSSVIQVAGKQVPDAYLVLASLHSKNKHYREAADALEGYLKTSLTAEQRENIKHKIEELRRKASQFRDSK
jgi:tetratricopeptide (TPR) repeat protein